MIKKTEEKNTDLQLLEKLRALPHGIITIKLAESIGVTKADLSRFTARGDIERVSLNMYTSANKPEDELYNAQKPLKNATYSHETALYIHRFIQDIPMQYTFTTFEKSSEAKYKFIYMDPQLYNVGIIEKTSPLGKKVRVYNMERTLCDVIRDIKDLEKENVEAKDIDENLDENISNIFREYMDRRNKNVEKLIAYGRIFGVEKEVTKYLRPLLAEKYEN
ncbi:MAG: hypothetical protein RR922_05905 [Clostridia bacterium]